MNILTSCISVVALIAWTSCHPAVGLGTRKRVLSTITSILFPQLPLLLAIKDCARASLLYDALGNIPGWGKAWTLKKSFLVVKGGIVARPLETPLSHETETSNYIIDHEMLVRLVSVGCVRYSDFPSTSEINDKSKANWFAKSITLFQLTWFITNFFYRIGHGYKVSRLEVLTTQWTICGAPALLLWWQCPQNIAVPYYVPVLSLSASRREPSLVPQPESEQLDALLRDGSLFHELLPDSIPCCFVLGMAISGVLPALLTLFDALIFKFHGGQGNSWFDTLCATMILAFSTCIPIMLYVFMEQGSWYDYCCGKYVQLLVSDYPILYEPEAESCDKWLNVATQIGLFDVMDRRQWQWTLNLRLYIYGRRILVLCVFVSMVFRLGLVITAFASFGKTYSSVYDVPKAWILEVMVHVGG